MSAIDLQEKPKTNHSDFKKWSAMIVTKKGAHLTDRQWDSEEKAWAAIAGFERNVRASTATNIICEGCRGKYGKDDYMFAVAIPFGGGCRRKP